MSDKHDVQLRVLLRSQMEGNRSIAALIFPNRVLQKILSSLCVKKVLSSGSSLSMEATKHGQTRAWPPSSSGSNSETVERSLPIKARVSTAPLVALFR